MVCHHCTYLHRYKLIRQESVSSDPEDEIEERRVIENELLEKSNSLQEQIKELNCLFDVAILIKTPPSKDDLLPALAHVLPTEWKYPDLTCARIIIRSSTFVSEGFQTTVIQQESDRTVYGKVVGKIEIFFPGDPTRLRNRPIPARRVQSDLCRCRTDQQDDHRWYLVSRRFC